MLSRTLSNVGLRLPAGGRLVALAALSCCAATLAAPASPARASLAVQHDSFQATSSNASGVIGPGDSFSLREKVVSAQLTPPPNPQPQTLTGVRGSLSSTDASVSVTQGLSTYPNLTFGVPKANDSPFTVAIPSNPDYCGINVPLKLDLTTGQGSQAVSFTVPTGVTGPLQPYDSSQEPLAIPSAAGASIISTLNVANRGRVKNVQVRLTRLTHTYDGDLRIELIAPDGTPVTLIDSNLANTGQNFISTRFSQSAPTPIASGSAPYSDPAGYRPAGDLSILNGKQEQGTWQLKVTTVSPGDTGTLWSWGADVAPAVCGGVPVAGLAITPSPAPENTSVTLDGSGSVAPVQGTTIKAYSWDPEGTNTWTTPSASPTLTHVFALRGRYNVGLKVQDSLNNWSAPASRPLSVTVAPIAAMAVSPNPMGAAPVTFDASGSTVDTGGSIVDYRWDLDGSGNYAVDSGSTPRVTTTYPSSRTVPVHVRITDDTGASATAGQDVTIANHPPLAALRAPGPILVGQSVTLDASASRDPDGSISDYQWDFGGGSFNFDGGAAPAATTTYSSPGPVIVRVRVTDNEGATTITSQTIQVTRPPVARLTAAPASTAPGQNVTLDASGSGSPDGVIQSYAWDLDGSGRFATGTGPTPFLVRAFPSAGRYSVAVRVTDNYGATATTTVVVNVAAVVAGAAGNNGSDLGAFTGGDPQAGIASLSRADLEAIIPGSEHHFAAITGDAVRRGRAVSSHGLWINLLADRPASFALSLSVSAADARRLKLVKRGRRGAGSPGLVALATAATRLTAAGQKPFDFAVSARLARAVRRLRSTVKLIVTGAATDAAGHQTQLARVFVLRR